MGLVQKLQAIMTDVGYLNKDTEISGKKASYNVISEKKVLSSVRPKLVEQGILVFPVDMHATREANVTTLRVLWKVIDSESGEEIQLASTGQGYDPYDKGAGMAQTYALKYLFLKMFQIITGDDPDYVGNETHEEEAVKNNVLTRINPDDWDSKQVYDICKSLNNVARINKLITPDQANQFTKRLDEVLESKAEDTHQRLTRALNMVRNHLSQSGTIPEEAEIPHIGYIPDEE